MEKIPWRGRWPKYQNNCTQTLYMRILNTPMLIPWNFYVHERNINPLPPFVGFNRHFTINCVGNRIRQMNAIKKILSKTEKIMDHLHLWSIVARCKTNREKCQLLRPKMIQIFPNSLHLFLLPVLYILTFPVLKQCGLFPVLKDHSE